MKTILLLNYYLLHSFLILAQSPTHKVTYHCTAKIMNGESHSGTNTLYFNQEEGLFIHNDWPKETTMERKDKPGGVIVNIRDGDDEGMPVYMNLKEKYLYYKTDYFVRNNTFFILKEALPTIEWNIQSDTKKIENFTCQKAVGDFGGRTYEVWFTMDIPVKLGPYKLHGLPGLILEVASTDGRVKYEFMGYEKLEASEIVLQKPQKGREISWEDFKIFAIKDLEKIESKFDNVTYNDPSENWGIEKQKFTIIGDYKRERNRKMGRYRKPKKSVNKE